MNDVGLQAVGRPFASVFPSELAKGERLMAINFLTNTASHNGGLALLYRVVEKLYGNPAAVGEINYLYGGRQYGGAPSLPQRIGGPEIRLETPLVPSVDLDVGRLGAIVTYNSFSPNCIQLCDPELDVENLVGPRGDGTDKPIALYTLPSLFNHACYSNAMWHCFGDVMAIRASEDIPSGCEITIPYLSTLSNSERARKLKDILEDRPCDCSLCAKDTADGIEACSKRSNIMKRWFKDGRARLAAGGTRGSKIIDETLAKLDATYHSNRTIRIEQFYIHGDAIAFYQSLGSLTRKPAYHIQAIKHGFRALQRAGLMGIDTSIQQGSGEVPSALPISTQRLGCPMIDPNLVILAMIHISRSFTCVGEPVHAHRWHVASQWSESVITPPEQVIY